MKIFLLRHGHAGEPVAGRADDERPLTRKGRKCTEAVLAAVQRVCKPDLVVSSPLLRARETAGIAREVLGVEAPLLVSAALVPGADPADMVRWLATRREETLLLAGHMPSLGILAAFLVCGVESEGIALKKSGICCIECEGPPAPSNGRLVWLVTPAFLDIQP